MQQESSSRPKNLSFDDAGKHPLWRRLLDLIFGYDFFISYSWSDGGSYANALTHQLRALGFQVFGASTQDTDYQKELVNRVHLPFEILSDANFELVKALQLPTFEYHGLRLVKRMTWVVEGGKIIKVFYPVFPPDKNADEVLNWLKGRKQPGPV